MYLTCTLFPRTLEWTEQTMGIGKKPMLSIALPSLAGRLRKNRRGFRARGFSLLELMIVLTIIMILASIAAHDLVSAKYIGTIPVDPITRQKDWHPVSDDMLLTPEQTTPGINDVHSSSELVSPFENTPYNTW